MDILRKIGDWAWENKERLVLAILVVFLVYRIYAVMNPTTIEEQSAQSASVRPQPAGSATTQTGEGPADPAAPGGGPQNRLRRLQQGAAGGAGATGETTTTEPKEVPFVFTQHMPPKRIPDPNALPEEWTEEEGRPPSPPPNPLPPAPTPYNALIKDNPFAAVSTGSADGPRGEERPNIVLLGIREWGDGTYRAQIYTRTRKWYEEGESFEAYQLISINPEEQSVEIFSEKHGRSFTYRVGR